MEFLLVGIITLLGAGLTLFSGFGLGTLLMPVFAVFFPLEIAIALTAIVHFSNNLIKLGFFYKNINRKILLTFGIPSVIASFAGAFVLTQLTEMPILFNYTVYGKIFSVEPLKLIIAVLLIFFSLMELIPKLSEMQFDKKYLTLGGFLSGFFGGISGNQGALRTAFLIRAGLTKEVFIATGVAIACFTDIARLTIYSKNIIKNIDKSQIFLLSFAVICAFCGVFIGNKLIKKITIKTLQIMVAVMLIIFAVLLGSGIL